MLIKNVCKGLVKKPVVSLICVLLLTVAMLLFQLAAAMTGVTTAPRVEKHLTIAVPAQSLFNEGLDSVKNVALLSGFSDPLYFSKVFKKRVGCAPTEYISRQNTP